MIKYTDADIHYGAGAFEQAMRTQTSIPGRAGRLSPGAAIGILSAAMRSGVPANLIEQMIDTHFGENVPLMRKVLAVCEGNDWSINLWHLQPTKQYKLCTDLCRPSPSHWRYDRFAGQPDE